MFKRTNELRVLKGRTIPMGGEVVFTEPDRLQQLWVDTDRPGTEPEWRDVPVEESK